MVGIRHLIGGVLILGAMVGASACCKGDCPSPKFETTATVAWKKSTVTLTSDAGVEPSVSVDVVDIQWFKTPKDVIPDSYYQGARFGAPSGAGLVESQTKWLAPRHAQVTFRSLSTYLKKSHSMSLDMKMGDTRGAVKCNHPGMPDSYGVSLLLDFDEKANTVSGKFGKVDMFAGALLVLGGTTINNPTCLNFSKAISLL
jgi:hypothetical protein